MRTPIAGVLGNHDGAWHVDPLAVDLEPDQPTLPHVGEVVRRPAIPVIAARRTGRIPVQGVIDPPVAEVSQCRRRAEREEEEGQMLGLHAKSAQARLPSQRMMHPDIRLNINPMIVLERDGDGRERASDND